MTNELVISQDLLLEMIKSMYNTNDEKHIKLFIKHTIQSFSCKFINDFIKLYSLMEMEFKSNVHESVKVNVDDKVKVNVDENVDANVDDKPLTSKRMQSIDASTFHFNDFLHECYSSIVNISGPDLYNLYCNYINAHVDLTRDLVKVPSNRVFINAFRKYTGNAKQKWINGAKKFLYSLKPDVYVKYAYCSVNE